jgi:N-carbamoyl-D-amino-acid hydrolase
MSRVLTIGAAQLGPIEADTGRAEVVERMLTLLEQAHRTGCDLVVYPELALTTFFPRWWFEDAAELDRFFETEMPGPETKPLFDEARRLGIGFSLGFAELTADGHRYNTQVLVERDGQEVGRYRKVHLPGHAEYEPWRPFQHLEKGYFEVGDGFHTWPAFGGVVGMAICNDRRWSETYRVLGLQGAELILIGFNTPRHYPLDPSQDRLAEFHNHLVMQAGAYQNGTFVVGVAKCGVEAGVEMIGESAIYAPSGQILAMCGSQGDELAVARCDLDWCRSYKETVFDFALHRQPQAYGLITEPAQAGQER